MDVLARAARLREEGRAFALATVVWTRGPSSGKSGCKAIIHPDGRVEGWLGGACAVPTVVRQALEALREGRAQVLSLGRSDGRSGVTEAPMACDSEGEMEVFVEPMPPAPRLVIAGSSPMTAALVEIAQAVGWLSWTAADPSQAEEFGRRAAGSYAVVATQGVFDEPALAAALPAAPVYLGLVASPKRAAASLDWLRGAGFSDEELARVQAPAGVDLGSTSHVEMAVSVMAGLVARKSSAPAAAAPPVVLPEQAADPVCGMSVDVSSAAFTARHGEETFFFCAAGCQSAFQKSPAQFLPA